MPAMEGLPLQLTAEVPEEWATVRYLVITSNSLLSSPRRTRAQVLPPATRPLVSLARSILAGPLDRRLLGSSGDGAT